ncbi:MAG: hypothetical protein WBS24_03600 [Terriglobales bacterium]
MTVKKKFALALIAYVVLGVLAWTTLSDEPIQVFDWNLKLRTGTLLILGLFAFKSALFFWRTKIEEPPIRESEIEESEEAHRGSRSRV